MQEPSPQGRGPDPLADPVSTWPSLTGELPGTAPPSESHRQQVVQENHRSQSIPVHILDQAIHFLKSIRIHP